MLSEKYQVIVLDNRGAGHTDKPDVPYSIEMMADYAAGVLNVSGLRCHSGYDFHFFCSADRIKLYNSICR